ncbi:MAG TPA: hypothetical protein VLE48_06925 [Terriglobales bacterium]|nr:hypothetical protein [Terriglobales bacterium]
MKRILLSLSVAALLAGSALAQQSLGELAREQRQKKRPSAPSAKVYTNENLPTTTTISEVGATPEASTSRESAAPGAGAAEAAPSADDQAQQEAEWKKRFSEQKDAIALLERELDVLERENKLRAATYYADAGNRLRDEAKYAADDRKYQADTAEKKQRIADAKQKLEDMREELRKAGLPASWGE